VILWCSSCQVHEVDPRYGKTCPVCADAAAKVAEARVAVMWADMGVGGRA
jgi:hypothetical protein